MPSQQVTELSPPSSEEINNLRDELRSLKLKGVIEDLDDNAIEEILHLPPSLFYEAIHYLKLAFGPLSSFPAAIPLRDKTKSKPPNPIVDDGESFLEDSITALNDYNKLLEEKIAKFKVQSTRSLATLKESSEVDDNITVLQEKIAEVKQRKSIHAQQIAILRDSLSSYDKNHTLKLEKYDQLFWNDIWFLNCYNVLSDNSHHLAQQVTPSQGLWDEYDYVLQHTERWRRLVNVDSHESKVIIDRAREHVNQLVYSITRHCQAQLATIFYESIRDSAARSDHVAVHDEAADIVKEIDWLWEEVIPVAHMSVSAQYLRPVLTTFENWERSKLNSDAIVTNYVRKFPTTLNLLTNREKASGVLKFMNDRLSAIAERTQTLVYHHQALNNVARVRQSSEAVDTTEKASGGAPHTLAQDTQTQRKCATASENLRAFMQIYGAAPVHNGDSLPKMTVSLLDEHVHTRNRKGESLLQDLHKLFEATTKSSLTDRELGGESLLESLLADSAASPSQTGSVYKDAQLEGSIAMLQGQAEQVQGVFNSLKLDGPASASDYVTHSHRQTLDRLTAKEGKQCLRGDKFEEFVRRWGS
ncbi:hypothetical protein FHL15_004708 [Xylaria flabelliformis]|uniref:Uncharacterized protein n=1 Tax=Xylaria flabelliformis TaxID=2512241 RepID=A0A553I2Y0_9PEZI|nr:hypothetical protein FHL15_004708 [Xylaria flabelliformis]